MKKLCCFLVLCLVALAAVCFGADAVTAVVTAAPPTVTLLAWFQANTAIILGVALALSELLAVIPAFKGNGLIDTIIKALRALSEKPSSPA